MKRTAGRALIVSFFSALILAGMFVYMFETHWAPALSNNLISTIFRTDNENYEYSISIPDYWDVYSTDSTSSDIIYTGNNSEYLMLTIQNREENYDASMYSAYRAIKIYGEYAVEVDSLENKTVSGKDVYYSQFVSFDTNYVVGFVENDTFLVDFVYKRPSTNNINASLYNIITSIEQFKVEEVNLNGEVVTK